MNKQPTTIRTYLLRGAFLLGLAFVIVMPLALGQSRNGGGKQSVAASSPCTLQPWVLAANYPLVSESVSVSSDGTFAYAVGGNVSGPTNAFNQYDPVANTWTPLPNIPGAFYDAPSVYAANTNSIYVFGGIDSTFTPSNVLQVYNITSGNWSTGAPMPGARYFAGAVYYDANGKIYVAGGFDASFTESTTTWEYDPVANTWNPSLAPIPAPTGGAGYSIVGQNFYLAGTWNGSLGSTAHYRYDIVADSWTSVAPVPVNIYRPDSASIGTNIYLVGGGNPDLRASATQQARIAASMRGPATSYTSTYIYDTLADTWSNGPNTNVAHSFTGGTAIGNLLIVVTGFDGVTGDTNIVERSDCLGGTPTPTPTPGRIVLRLNERRGNDRVLVRLRWTGANTASVKIFRNGALLARVQNTGSYTDVLTAPGIYTYQVCENGGSGNCSNEKSVRGP